MRNFRKFQIQRVPEINIFENLFFTKKFLESTQETITVRRNLFSRKRFRLFARSFVFRNCGKIRVNVTFLALIFVYPDFKPIKTEIAPFD